MTSRLLSAFLVVGLSFAACKKPRTEVVLSVDSDLTVPTELDAVQIMVAGGQAAQPFDQTYQLGPGKTKLPIVLGLVPGGDKGLAFRVEVSGLSGGTAVVKRSTSTSFVPKQTLSLSLQLLRTCVQKTCNSGETCGSDGRCVSEGINPATLPKHGSSTGDAGVLVAKDTMEVTLDAGADRNLDTNVDVPGEVAPPNKDAPVLLDVQVDTVVPREDVGSADSAFDVSPDSPFVHQDSNDVAAGSTDTRPTLPIVSDAGPPCEPNVEEVTQKKMQQAATKAMLEGKAIRRTVVGGGSPLRYVFKNGEIIRATLDPVTLQPTATPSVLQTCDSTCIQETRCYLACPLDTMWVSVLSGDKKTTVCVGPFLDCEYDCHGANSPKAGFYRDLARGVIVIE